MQVQKEKSAALIYLMLFSMVMINYLDRVALSVAAKPIASEFHLNPIQLGYVFSSFLWSYIPCALLCGVLVDRFGARKVCATGMLVWSTATIFTGLASGIGSLLATRLVMGAGEASSYPSGNKFIREHVPVSKHGFATSVMNSGAYAGPAVGAVLIAWLVTSVGWRLAFCIAGAIGFVWVTLWLLWFRRNGNVSASGVVPMTLSGRRNGVGLKGLLRSGSMWGITLTHGCNTYTQYLFLTWLPSYLIAAKGLDIKHAAVFTAVPYGCAVIFGSLIGKLSDRLLRGGDVGSGKRRRMVAGMLLCAATILAIPFIDSVWTLVAVLSVTLTGIAAANSLNLALINDLLVHNDDAGKAYSLAIVGSNMFGVLAPIITGYVIAITGSYNYAFVGAGTLLLCGAVISLTRTRERIGVAESVALLDETSPITL
ncbi:MFS transporter [Paraburkholderia sediminicola]|uniref:MFS transporter n=1 Tax=Paraburkholderia sediminicola TaxID=458836 RepID=UPI0038BC01F5